MTTTPLYLPGLRVHYASSNFTSPDWTWDSRRNRWKGWLLWSVASGKGEIIYPGPGGAHYPIEPGACFLFNMGEHHLGRADLELEVRAIGFMSPSQDSLWPGCRRFRQIRQDRLLWDLMDRSIADHEEGHPDMACHWLLSALAIVASEDAQPRHSGLDRQRQGELEAIAHAIKEDPAGDWSVKVVQERLKVGRERAIRLFTKHMGYAPQAWIIRFRLQRARYLLRFSSHSIRAIAESVGYRDPFYFSRLFKRHENMSPRAYRNLPWEEDRGTG